MSEILEAEIDLATHEAFNNLQAFLAQLERTQSGLDRLSTNVSNADRRILALSETARRATEINRDQQIVIDKTSKSYEVAGDKAEESGKKADAGNKAAKASTDDWSSAVTNLVTSYLGFHTIIALINKANDAQKSFIDTQRNLVQQRVDFDKQLRDFQFNLNLPLTAQGQEQGRALLKQFMQAAPGADIPTIQQVAGQATAFGFGVTQAGAGQEIAIDAMRMASRLGLAPETAGDLMRVVNAMGARDPMQARTIFAQMEAAARTSPIASPRDFMTSALRATMPMITQGVPVQQAFGMFAAAAGPETSPERAATQAEQFQRLFRGGPEDKPLASLFNRALQAGLLDRRKFGDIEKRVADAIMPEFSTRINTLQRTMEDAQADLQTDEGKFNRDMAEIQRRQQTAQNAGRDTAGFAAQTLSRQEAYDKQRRETLQRITHVQEGMTDVGRESGKKIFERFGATAWRSLPLTQRMGLFQRMAAIAKTPQELEAFLLSAGASAEEARAGINILSGGGPRAAEATAAEMSRAAPGAFAEANAQFEGLDISKDMAMRNRIMMGLSGATGTAEQRTEMLAAESAARAQQLTVKTGGRPATGTGTMSEEYFRAHVFRDDLMGQVMTFMRTVTDDELQRFPELDQILADLDSAGLTMRELAANVGMGGMYEARLHSIANRFFAVASRIMRYRAENPNRPRGARRQTELNPINKPPPQLQSVPRVPVLEIGFRNALGIPDFGGESAAAINYSVSIGTLVSTGADVFDTVGRLDASERA